MILRWLLAVSICFAVIAGLGLVKFTQVKAAIAFGESFPEPSETVEATTTLVSTWQPQIKVIGEVKAPKAVILRNELEGIIRSVNFQSGERVLAGKVLLQLDITDELAQLAAIDAQIQLAKLEVTRLEKLLVAKAGSKDLVDKAKAELDIATARKASLQAIISRKSIIAPFDGTTGLHQFEVGQYLSSNSVITELIGDTNVMWVDFSLPQQDAGIIVNTDVSIGSIDERFAPVSAKVIARSKRLETQSRSRLVRAEVKNDDALLTAGEVVEVSVPVEAKVSVIELPITSVRQDRFGSFVYVLNKDKQNQYRAKRQPVNVLNRSAETVMISSDIGEGVTVATLGSYKLKPDLLTYVKDQ